MFHGYLYLEVPNNAKNTLEARRRAMDLVKALGMTYNNTEAPDMDTDILLRPPVVL